MLMLYNALVVPHLNDNVFMYDNVWATNFRSNITKIFNMQKRIIPIIEGAHRRALSSPLLIFFKILNIWQKKTVNCYPTQLSDLSATRNIWATI